MRNFLFCWMFVFMFCMSANAVQKCIAMQQGATVCMATNQGDYYTKWSGSCSTDGKTSVVSGLGLCSSYDSSASPKQGAPLGIGTHCWCKMIKPARSQWVFAYTLMDAGACAQACGAGCAKYVGLSNFMKQILSTVSN